MNPPSDITRQIMGKLNDNGEFSTWRTMYKTLAEARNISWRGFSGINEQAQNKGFYFLIVSLFFFLIGSALFTSVFYIGHLSKITAFIVLQSVLVLMSAISLMMGGILTASGIPGFERMVKTSIWIYEILIILCAILTAAMVTSVLGVILAVTFVAAGIMTGITLMKAVDNRSIEHKGSFTGELNNA